MDRILEAELAVEQKSDQGVEGPGGTGGSGSSVSDGLILSLEVGVGVGEGGWMCSAPHDPLLSIPPHLALN